jgi:signal transduction histidine kinase
MEKALKPGKTKMYCYCFPSIRLLLDVIRNSLLEELGDSCNLHIEYLETEKYSRDEYPKEKFDLYNKKFRDIKLDLLICVGIDIIKTVKKNAENYLLDLPTISLDYDFSLYGYPADLNLNQKTIVFNIKADIKRTISEALKIFPDTKSIYFIGGVNVLDKKFMDITKEEAKSIDASISKIFIYDKSMDEILRIIRTLPLKAIIINTSFNTDIQLVPYYNPEAVRLIRDGAKVPVFTYSDMGLGDGSFGGWIISFHKIAKTTGEIAVKLLKGADPNSIKITEKDYYDYLFDYRELKIWNKTKMARNEKGSSIMFEDVSFLGKYIWLFVAGIIFLIFQTLLIIALVRMYHSQKRMTKQILDAEKRYMEIIHEDRILRTGMLTASISHELNQPLTAILSTAQAGKRFFESGNWKKDELIEIFKNIVEDSKRAASILSSLRGLMKLEKREKEKINLNTLLIETINLYQGRAIEQHIKLSLLIDEAPVVVVADSIQIQQVLLNLIYNASQSVETANTSNKTIIISETLNDKNVIVSVRDFGKGIDEEIKNRLFEPFRSSRSEGMGIGLAISKMIIEEHNGNIWADNMPEGGAKISFSLYKYDESKH